jgi:hypothetical protein
MQCESDVEMEPLISIANDSSSDDDNDDDELNPTIQWQKVTKKMLCNPFMGPTPGPVIDEIPVGGNELDFFYLLFPETIWDTITKSTNKYVQIYEAYRNSKVADGEKAWQDRNFKTIEKDEIKAYVGIRMIMAISNKTSQHDYWSSHPALHNAYISSIMTRSRFFEIQRYFHIADPTKDPTRLSDKKKKEEAIAKDPLYKVSILLEHIRARCKDLYNLHTEVSVDEAMIKFHGTALWQC